MFKVFKRVYKLSEKYKKQINISIVLQFLDSSLAFVPVGVVMMFFQRYLDKSIDPSFAMTAFFIMLAGIVVRTLVRYYIDKHQFSTLYRIFADERINIANHLKQVNMGFFTDDNIGSISTTLTNGITFIEEQGFTSIVNIITSVISLFIIFVMLTVLNPTVGIIYLASIVITAVILKMYYAKSIDFANEYNVANERLTSAIIEYVKNISVIKSFNLIGNHNRTNEAFKERRRIDLKSEAINIPYIIGSMIVMSLGTCAMIYAILNQYKSEQTSLYIVITISILSMYAYRALEVIVLKISLLILSCDNLDSVDALYNQTKLEIYSDKKPSKYDIEFKNVKFAYEDKNVIDNISFKLEEKTMNALVGVSGSGKSTLVNLIPRFFDNQSGEILIGGVNIKEMSAETLYDCVSMVFQNVYLFKDTIYNNIAFGNDKATREQVIQACKKARCYEFIMELPDGFETLVGEAGMSLSGGQRQRISIARAILKDSPIILLDEATASIDPDNEHEIQKAINELVKNKTILVIAHKLSCVKNANNILVINDGKLVEEGKHDELLERGDLYSDLWSKRINSRSWKIGKTKNSNKILKNT